jgi:uncharacterized membrane protein YfcA
MFFAYLVYGIFAGFISGFLGVGAGCLLLPFFILMNIPYDIAVDASLMAVFLCYLTNTWQYHKTTGVAWEPCLVMAVPAAICAIIGNVFLIHHIPPLILQLVFAGLMLANVDLLLFIRKRKVTPVNFQTVEHKQFFILYLLMGAATGLATSLLSMGGSIIIVPLLVCLVNFSVKDAVRVAVAVTVVTTFFSMTPEIAKNTLPYAIGGWAAIGTIIGGFFGSIALKYVRQDIIIKANYSVSLGLGFIMLGKILINSL